MMPMHVKTDKARLLIAAAIFASFSAVAHACPSNLFPTYRATVTRIVDGDTFDARVSLGLGVYKDERIRILGINTPEREQGKAATERTKQLLPLGSTVGLATQADKRDSFGRLLACAGNASYINIGDVLLREGLAVPY